MNARAVTGRECKRSAVGIFLSGSQAFGDSLAVRTELVGWNPLGEKKTGKREHDGKVQSVDVGSAAADGGAMPNEPRWRYCAPHRDRAVRTGAELHDFHSRR